MKKTPKPKAPIAALLPDRIESVHQSTHRKRDHIVSKVKFTEVPSEYEQALQRMEDHLRGIKKRCTVERRFVLQMLYQASQPLDVVTLHQQICQDLGHIAVPTVYSTLELLVELRLARRIELVNGMAFFERTLGVEPHGFAVCEQCGTFTVISSPTLLQDLQPQLRRGFVPASYTLIIHGLCSKCKRAGASKKNKKQ